jgi:hypothetical protein
MASIVRGWFEPKLVWRGGFVDLLARTVYATLALALAGFVGFFVGVNMATTAPKCFAPTIKGGPGDMTPPLPIPCPPVPARGSVPQLPRS